MRYENFSQVNTEKIHFHKVDSGNHYLCTADVRFGFQSTTAKSKLPILRGPKMSCVYFFQRFFKVLLWIVLPTIRGVLEVPANRN